MRSILALLLFLALTTPALATDGVLEINQTCAVQTGCFGGDTAGLPVTITTPGSYRLTSNLIVPDENTSGILVSTNDVGIDLNNFAIIRSGCENATTSCVPTSGTGSGVIRAAVENRGISVKNGSVSGMGEFGIWLGDQAEVHNVTARWNRSDGIGAGSGSRVSDCSSFENGFTGISMGAGAIVSGNVVYENGCHGIRASANSVIDRNSAYDNGCNGIGSFGGSSIQRNSARGNGTGILGGVGIHAGSNTTYRGNTITNNVTGAVDGGGVNLGDNYCAGTNVVSASCP